MNQPCTSLPFTVPDLFAGFADGEGIAKVSETELVLEFVIRDSLLEVFKTGVKEVHIPRTEIAAVQYTRGWFKAQLRLRVKSLKWLSELPGCDNGEVVLQIARRHRDEAEQFAQQLAPPGLAQPQQG